MESLAGAVAKATAPALSFIEETTRNRKTPYRRLAVRRLFCKRGREPESGSGKLLFRQ